MSFEAPVNPSSEVVKDVPLNNSNSRQSIQEMDQSIPDLEEHLDTAELESIAVCFDNIRQLR